MFRRLIDQFIHQTQISAHITSRDRTKRVAISLILSMVAGYAGFQLMASATMFIILLFEVLARPLNDRAARFDQPISFPNACLVWTINWLSLLSFLALALILSKSSSAPFLMAGFIWIFGIFVHVSNTFGLLPVYNWSLMVPSFATLFTMIRNMSENATYGGTQTDWLITAAIATVYILNTFDTMNRQKDTHRALALAREEANARLMELERLSRYDSLTGLMNRRAFDEVVQSMIHHHQNKQGVTVFLIDLDGFKPINDSYSHQAGDVVLCAIADRLQQIVGKDARVARLGGDEFAVLRTSITSATSARQFGQRIVERLTQPIFYEQKMLSVGASIGVARQGAYTDSPATLIAGADQAMYLAKQDPERHPKIYDPAAFPHRPTLEDRQTLLDAMLTGQILPHYQPKIRLDGDDIVGFEALSRWHHPRRGLLAPSEFIPMINDLGLQGTFMIHTAELVLHHLAALVEEGLQPGQVSINVPEVALATHSGLNDLFAVIDRYPHLRHHLTFEITEDIFIARSGEIIRQSISSFRKAGVRISLDDFGTGFASFQHLKELEFDELKLDTGFVRDLGIDPAAHVLIDGLLTIAAGLGVDVIAEGVETRQQRDMLHDMGCNVVQGYFYGAAVPFDETHLRLIAESQAADRRRGIRRGVA